ncbi:MAG: HAMP domain-containing protein, partial [Alphaproteobacteria bacterium]
MPRTLFGKIFIWSALAQAVTLGSILALVTFYLPASEDAVNNAWALYAHTAVALLERFGPGALDQFLKTTGEDTLLKLRLEATNVGTPCSPNSPSGIAERSMAAAVGDATTSIASRGLDGDYCLTVHAKAGGLPESPENRRSRLQIAILFELLSCAALSYLVARYLARPISELRSAAARLARGDLTARVGSKYASRNDEAADLVREFDQMAERVSELIETQRRLIGDISHEIKSPLARLSVALGLARRSAEDYAPKQFARMQREIEKISLLVSELLTLAQLEQTGTRINAETIDLPALVEKIVGDAVYESQDRAADVTFQKPAEPILVQADEILIRRAIENVLRNAIFYT